MMRTPEDIFRSQMDAGFVTRDVDAFVSHFAPDCVCWDMSEPRPRVGHEAIRSWAGEFHRTMVETEVEYLIVFGGGDFVLGEFILRGVRLGGAASGSSNRVARRYCVIDEIHDGLVTRETVYGAPHELEQQFDVAQLGYGA